MKNISGLQTMLAATIEALGYDLLGCTYVPQGRCAVLRVYIDSTQGQGITVADCERVSRQLSAVLDVEDPIPGAYTLEVSSPGLDRPLFSLAHFQRYIGAMLRISLHTSLENRRHFKGRLQAVHKDEIIICAEGKEFVLPFSNIDKANLLPEIGLDRKGKKS